MRHQQHWEYWETGTEEHWKPTTPQELLFELIPSGKAQAWRLTIVNLEIS